MMDAPGVIFLRVPGVDGLAFGHLLRAIFTAREDQPLGMNFPTVPEGYVDAQSALMGHFPGDRAREYRRLLKDRRTLRVTVIGEPAAVQRRVYRHLIASQPELVGRRPEVFGSEDVFLATCRDEVTKGLARVLRTRRVRVADFDVVLVEERMEESLRTFVDVAMAWAHEVGAPRRIGLMLEAAREFEGSLVDAFGGGAMCQYEGPTPSVCQYEGPTPSGFSKRNAADVAFYERAPRGGRRNGFFALRGWKAASPSGTEPVFVFNHLPKSYGTSLRQFFGRVFGGVEDQTEFLGRAGLLDDAPVDSRRVMADTLICGHFAHGAFLLQRRYPEIWANAERFRLFTFVRDPLATAVSNFHHVRRHDPAAVAREPELYASLENYLGALENPIAQRLGCDSGSVDAVLGRYFFVGAAEHHLAGLGVLLGRMGGILEGAEPSATVERARSAVDWLAGQPLEHANAGGSGGDDGVSAGVREGFQRRNALDYEIYRRARG